MGAPIDPPWYQLALVSAGVSAVISSISTWSLAMWSGSRHKLRKYEEALIEKRVAKCNELLQMVLDLCLHLSPVSKGTGPLERRGSSNQVLPPDSENPEIQKTLELRSALYDFVQRNALFLGKDICLHVIYFDVGFDELSYQISVAANKPSHHFYTLCQWTWMFEDGIKDAITRSLRDATFTPPSALEHQSARTKGYSDIRKLIEAVESHPDAFSIDARNAELKKRAATMKLGFEIRDTSIRRSDKG